jgi:hypothetical protein
LIPGTEQVVADWQLASSATILLSFSVQWTKYLANIRSCPETGHGNLAMKNAKVPSPSESLEDVTSAKAAVNR